MMAMMQELGLLLVLVLVAILTYSSLVYFAERDVKVLGDKNKIVSPSKLLSKILASLLLKCLFCHYKSRRYILAFPPRVSALRRRAARPSFWFLATSIG